MVCVYDIETYPNIFTFVFKDIFDKKFYIFEISSRKDDSKELVSFISQDDLKLIGYNCLTFDYPILHRILTKKDCNVKRLYKYVQDRIIGAKYPDVPEWQVKIPQCDLYKINHYDNDMRRTSLKWLEFTLRWPKLQDLPFNPNQDVPEDKFDDLIQYNINDVEFTEKFFEKCKSAIEFRQDMSKELKKNVMNYSDVKIGEYINRVTFEKLSGMSYTVFKNSGTKRNLIEIKDLIPSFIVFKTSNLQEFLSDIRNASFLVNDDSFSRHITIGDMDIKFAKGGLHSKDTPKVFRCKKDYYLKEKDVGSMYPASIINSQLYPKHLGKSWYLGIKQLYDERINIIKPKMKTLDTKSKEYKSLDSKQQSYKLAMNGGGYGKTGLEYSWQYDPLVMYKVTFKGQLSLLMLLETYYLMGAEIISANTDGIVIHYPKSMEQKVLKAHKDWEKLTGYSLEDTFYKQIIFRDVNNYIAEIIDEKTEETKKIKFKGCFEIDTEYHKNNSQRIVAIALKEYFINGVAVTDVIKNPGYKFVNSKGEEERTTIYDYCRGVKKGFNTDHYAFVDGKGKTKIDDKVIRYYISNSNTKMYKVYDKVDKDGNIMYQAINKGFYVTPFMQYIEEDYNINYDYYINECSKIIEPIIIGTNRIGREEDKQLTLF